MNGITHKAVGVSTVTAIAICTYPSMQFDGNTIYPIAGLLLASIGSTLADIDIEGSSMARKFPWLTKDYPLIGRPLTHRGLTHTGFILCIWCIVLLILNRTVGSIGILNILTSVWWGFTVGYASHLFADMLNYKGIPILFPIFRKKIHIMAVATGTYQETIFISIWLAMLVAHVLMCLLKITI